MRLALVVVSLLFLATLGESLKAWYKKPRHRPHMLMGRPAHGFRPPLESQFEESVTTPSPGNEGYFSQILDHFDPTNSATWTQHYFYNWKFYVRGGPVFLNIGGEGPESVGWVTREDLPFVAWAKQYGAGIVSLEHRYYGKSRPTPDQSVSNLKYLSSRQAIEDIATFVQFINQQFGLSNPPWIAFGGSYSGAMALWVRQIHPELIAGAVGSSGPVNAKLDFYEYLQVVEASLRTFSNACADNVGAGFRILTQLMNTVEGRKNLTDTFLLTPALEDTNLTYTDLQTFYGSVFGNFQGAVQYSGDNAGAYAIGYGIPEVCGLMIDETRPLLQRLQDVNNYTNSMYGAFQGTDISYTEFIQGMLEENWDSDYANDRSWTWQTCTEFGYFQSTDQGQQNIFGATSPNNWNIDFCTDVFGAAYTVGPIADAINSTLNYYGGADRYTGTNVVIPNGSLDPWHALGKYSNNNDSTVVPYLINGTAHCADMYPLRDSSAPGLAVVQALITQNLNRWINNWTYAGPSHSESKPIDNPKEPEVEPWKLLKVKEFVSTLSEVQEPYEEPKMHPIRPRLPFLINGRPHFGLRLTLAPRTSRDYPPGFVAGTIVQPLDHFDNTNPGTFRQRYWKNPQWAQPGGPNFLMIGGEGPESDTWVTDETLTYLTWAQKYGATVYLLEHRYYGNSIVNDGRSNQDLRYLSSVQMQYDLRQFILTVKNVENNTAPWITFGGSYSGAMSAWARQLFPDLIVGAVGSSGPVYAKTDFYEYLQVVEASIRTYNNDCANLIGQAFDTMQKLSLTPQGRVNLSTTFTLIPAWDLTSSPAEIDYHYFFSNIFGAFQGAVQYSGDNRGAYATGHGIPNVCQIMLNSSQTPLQNVAQVNVYMAEMYGPFPGTDNLFQDLIDYLLDESQSGAERLWTWQTCTEFGYYQSTDLGRNIFGSPTPVNMYIEMCRATFAGNFTAPSIDAYIAATQKFYGGRDAYRGTNVVLPNGSLDPWHALGKYSANDPSVVPFLINGTAHCSDMYPKRDSDASDLPVVRQLIDDNIAKWLSAVPPAGTVTGTTGTGTAGTGGTTQIPTTGQSSGLRTLTALVLCLTLSLKMH